jgi:hypothetical protein
VALSQLEINELLVLPDFFNQEFLSVIVLVPEKGTDALTECHFLSLRWPERLSKPNVQMALLFVNAAEFALILARCQMLYC